MRNERRLQTRIWRYFAVFAIALLGALWVLQLSAFEYFYYQKESERVEALGEMVADHWRNVRFSQAASIKFYQDEVPVRIFNAAGVANSAGVLQVSDPDPLDEREFIRKYEEAGEKIYMEHIHDTTIPNNNFLIYGTKIVNENDPANSLYIYIINTMGPLSSVRDILREQLLILSVLLILLGVGMSYFMAKRIAKPLVGITEKARQLAEGDYEVVFEDVDIREIHQLSETLNYATQELVKNDRMKSELLANVSHDLRTPLTMIKAYAEMIRDLSGGDPMRRSEHLNVIIKEADWMSMMITDILDFSRIQSGNMHYEMVRFDLNSLTRECVRHLNTAAIKDHNVEIRLEGEDGMMVCGDMNRIQRVINNLVSNAVKHSPEGSCIDISIERNGEAVHWQVKDYGSGIPPENLDRIWEQYFTHASAEDRMTGGTGLGLSIVRGILEAHDARYGVSSVLDEGTTFWFELTEDII